MAKQKSKKKRGILWALIIILVLLIGANAVIINHLWYQENHVFIEDSVYPIKSTELDLRDQDISFEHYNTLRRELPDCIVKWNVPFQGAKYDCDITELALTEATVEDVAVLKTYFPKLEVFDASQCEDYEFIEWLKTQFPEKTVRYMVSIGGSRQDPGVEKLELHDGEYTMEELVQNLRYLHNVQSVLIHKPEISAAGMDAVKEAYPEIEFAYTVELLEEELDAEITELNLADVTSVQLEETAAKLALLPNLQKIELCKADNTSNLAPEEARILIAAAPNAVFHYSFDFYGVQLSTDTEEVHITNKKIGDSGEADIRLALDLLTNCKRFVLEYCGVSNDVLAKIRDDYRDRTKVVWRVFFGKGSSLTDADVIRCTYDLVDDNSHDLMYCEDARFMDIGHNEYLDGIKFISGMKSLEYVIISGAPIKDLTPLSNCKNLKVLEIAFCMYVTDISPLAGCESLEMLNMAMTNAKDLSGLDELPLKTLCAKQTYKIIISAEEQQRFKDKHPDCLAQFALDGQPYGQGWRYDSKNEKLEWYALIGRAFKYPNPINNAGWYFDEDKK